MDVRAKVVEAVMQYGPHYSQISKVTGIPISTVRYIITKIMPKFGLFIRPAINYGMLGLQRYLVKFDTPYPPQYISVLLDLFGEIMYLDYYTFLMKSRKFLTTFVVPLEFENDFSLFINELKDLNIIKNYDMKKLKYMRVLPFRVECYDFHNGVWLQNWVRIKRKYSIPEIYEIPISLNITKLDITILAEVHENVFIKYVELAKKLNVTRQTIKKHYEYVKKMIYLYAITWVPIWNPDLVSTPLIIQSLITDADKVRENILNIPFSYMEMRTEDNDYYAMFLVPSMNLYQTLRYLGETVKLESLDFPSMEYAGKFAPHYNLYEDNKGWLNPFKRGLEKILEKVTPFKEGGY